MSLWKSHNSKNAKREKFIRKEVGRGKDEKKDEGRNKREADKTCCSEDEDWECSVDEDKEAWKAAGKIQ